MVMVHVYLALADASVDQDSASVSCASNQVKARHPRSIEADAAMHISARIFGTTHETSKDTKPF